MMSVYRQVFIAVFIISTTYCRPALSQELFLRVFPIGQFGLLCCITNNTPDPFNTPGYFFSDNNNIVAVESTRQGTREFGIGPYNDWLELPQQIAVPADRCRVETVLKQTLMSYLRKHSGEYLKYFWECGALCSQIVNVGVMVDNDSAMFCPFVAPNETNASVRLAFVFHEFNPNDLAFIYLNGDMATHSLHSPIGPQSSLLISAPSIGYSNEVTSVTSVSTNALVAPRMAEHWRIPWSDVWTQIPAKDRQKLEKAGDLDLRWKCGDLVSDPLPLWVGSLDGVTNCPYATGCM